jgi:hypothetical protein
MQNSSPSSKGFTILVLYSLVIFLFGGSGGRAEMTRHDAENHPARNNKKHHYSKFSRTHSTGLSDDWLGVCGDARKYDYLQDPITDPDPSRTEARQKQRESGSSTSPSPPFTLPFTPAGGDKFGLKVLIVTVDTRPLQSIPRSADTEAIDKMAMINHHYADRHGYDYVYIKTTEPGKKTSTDRVCGMVQNRFNCSYLGIKHHCSNNNEYDMKYAIATYHVGREYGRAASWNKMPSLIYLANEYGHKYDYFLFMDSDVMLNAKYGNVTISEKLRQWQTQNSTIDPRKSSIQRGNKNIRDSHLITLTNFPWRDDFPCAGVFLVKPDQVGVEILLDWWDYHLPLKNHYDFMEQDALWYMIENDGDFKVNSTTFSMVFEAEFLSSNTGITDLFFAHMPGYEKRKIIYARGMIHALEVDIHSTGSMQHPVMDVSKIKKYHEMALNTLGLVEYAELTRLRMNVSMREEDYYPRPRMGKTDDVWHLPSESKILPFKERSKFFRKTGHLYNGYVVAFWGSNAMYYVENDKLHLIPDWSTFVEMGFDTDFVVYFSRNAPEQSLMERGPPIHTIAQQKKGLGLFNTGGSNG